MVTSSYGKCPQCGGLMYVYKEKPDSEFNKCYACGYLYDSEDKREKPKE